MTKKKTKAAVKIGRPTIYDPSICDQVIKHMSEGLTFTAALFEIGISRAVAYTWMDKESDVFKQPFLDAKKIGEEGFEAWLAKQFRDNMHYDAKYPFNTTTAIWLSKAVCKWKEPEKDKEENSNTFNINMAYKPEEL